MYRIAGVKVAAAAKSPLPVHKMEDDRCASDLTFFVGHLFNIPPVHPTHAVLFISQVCSC